MALSSFLAAQIGFAPEVTAGTRVAPTRFFPLLSEDIDFRVATLTSQAIRVNRRIPSLKRQGKKEVVGGVQFECAPQGFGILLKNAIGGVATTGAGPYTHTFTPGDLDDKTFSVQVVEVDDAGADFVRDYVGMSITDWSLEASIDDYLKMGLSFYGMDELAINTNARAVASYTANQLPLVFTEQAVSIAGSGQDVKRFRFGGANNLATGRHQITATNPGRPKVAKESGRRQYSGEIVVDLVGTTQYNRYKNGTEGSMVFSLDQGAHELVITINAWFGGTTPKVTGPEGRAEMTVPFEVLHATADASGMTAVLINADSAP